MIDNLENADWLVEQQCYEFENASLRFLVEFIYNFIDEQDDIDNAYVFDWRFDLQDFVDEGNGLNVKLLL